MTVITDSAPLKTFPLKEEFFSPRRNETRVKIREDSLLRASLELTGSILRNIRKNNVDIWP